MAPKRTDEFRQNAVRITLTSGLSRKQVTDDLGARMSTLSTWRTAHRDPDVISQEDLGVARQTDRLRREFQRADYGRSVTAQPVADNALTWSRWPTSKNNPVSALAAMAGRV